MSSSKRSFQEGGGSLAQPTAAPTTWTRGEGPSFSPGKDANRLKWGGDGRRHPVTRPFLHQHQPPSRATESDRTMAPSPYGPYAQRLGGPHSHPAKVMGPPVAPQPRRAATGPRPNLATSAQFRHKRLLPTCMGWRGHLEPSDHAACPLWSTEAKCVRVLFGLSIKQDFCGIASFCSVPEAVAGHAGKMLFPSLSVWLGT